MSLPIELQNYFRVQTITCKPFQAHTPLLNDSCAVLRQSHILPGSHAEIRFQILLQCVEYTQGQELLILCGYSRYLEVPRQIQPIIQEQLNQWNKHSAGRFWAVYLGKAGLQSNLSDIGLVSTHLVGRMKREQSHSLFTSALRMMSEEFRLLTNFLLELYKKDSDFLSRYTQCEAQVEVLNKKGFAVSYKQVLELADITRKVLLEQEFPNLKISLFQLYTPIFLTYTEDYLYTSETVKLVTTAQIDMCWVEISIEFLFKGQEVKFEHRNSALEAWTSIFTLESVEHNTGCFQLSSTNKLIYSLKALHLSVDRKSRTGYIQMLVETARSEVKTNLNSLLQLYSEQGAGDMASSVPLEMPASRTSGSLKNYHALRQSVSKTVWQTYFLRVVTDIDSVRLQEDLEAQPLSNQPDSIQRLREFLMQMGTDGLFFHRIPIQCVYLVKNELKLAPFFDVADIAFASTRDAYQDFLSAALARLFSTALPAIVSIDVSSFAAVNLTDSSKLFIPSDILRYYNKFQGENVLLRLLSGSYTYKVGRLMYLSHENILKVIGLTQYEENSYLVTEHADSDLVTFTRTHSLSLKEKLQLIKDIAAGVSYLHSNAQLHLRLRPETVLVTSRGVAKVADFGLFQGKMENNPKEFLYSAPELFNPPAKIQSIKLQKADVWSLGVIMHFLVLQTTNPFGRFWKPDISKQEFFKNINLWKRRPLIGADFEGKYPGLVLLMRRCLYPEPDQRPSVSKVIESLARLEVVD